MGPNGWEQWYDESNIKLKNNPCTCIFGKSQRERKRTKTEKIWKHDQTQEDHHLNFKVHANQQVKVQKIELSNKTEWESKDNSDHTSSKENYPEPK